MSNLVAVAYTDEATAREVGQTLMELQKEHSIELEDLAIAVRQDDGKIKLRQTFKPAATGAAGGALWGGLIGLIFFMPLLGAAIGGATGAAAGAASDVGVDDSFMKDLGAKLQPGGAAVFVLVRQSTPDKVLPRISQYGGDVIHSSLSQDAEEALQEALRGRRPPPRWGRPARARRRPEGAGVRSPGIRVSSRARWTASRRPGASSLR